MKSFSERNPVTVGLVGIAVVVGAVVVSLQYDKLPFVESGRHYTAHFAEAGGLKSGSAVQVAGYRVGQVTSVSLDGAQVLVDFTVDNGIRLGERTEAAIKTETLLGARVLAVSPRGDGHLTGTIPVDRTTAPYELPDALGELASTISGLDTGQLNESLTTLAQTFQNTPPKLKAAVDGVGRLSEALNKRDTALRDLLADSNKVTGVLAQRTDQLVSLLQNTNALLAQLQTQAASLDTISANIVALSQQLSGLVADNKTQLKPALDKLNDVLGMVDAHKDKVQKSIKMLNAYALGLGEAVASGPFFKGYIVNLVPGNLAQPFIDAAFSDLGLDPSVLLPSQLTDPQTGQPATPALPVPFPRTGQGGDPRLTLPDAITGNPGDPGCGPPGVPLPGPTGCYPYRQPPPQPPAGGPPPGPPAGYDPAAPAEPPGLVPPTIDTAQTPTVPLPPMPPAVP